VSVWCKRWDTLRYRWSVGYTTPLSHERIRRLVEILVDLPRLVAQSTHEALLAPGWYFRIDGIDEKGTCLHQACPRRDVMTDRPATSHPDDPNIDRFVMHEDDIEILSDEEVAALEARHGHPVAGPRAAK